MFGWVLLHALSPAPGPAAPTDLPGWVGSPLKVDFVTVKSDHQYGTHGQ